MSNFTNRVTVTLTTWPSHFKWIYYMNKKLDTWDSNLHNQSIVIAQQTVHITQLKIVIRIKPIMLCCTL